MDCNQFTVGYTLIQINANCDHDIKYNILYWFNPIKLLLLRQILSKLINYSDNLKLLINMAYVLKYLSKCCWKNTSLDELQTKFKLIFCVFNVHSINFILTMLLDCNYIVSIFYLFLMDSLQFLVIFYYFRLLNSDTLIFTEKTRENQSRRMLRISQYQMLH